MIAGRAGQKIIFAGRAGNFGQVDTSIIQYNTRLCILIRLFGSHVIKVIVDLALMNEINEHDLMYVRVCELINKVR